MKILLNDIYLNYNEHGNPDKQPIIFIHGFPFCSKMWDKQISALANNYRIITYDVRGHGLSDVGDGQFTIEQFVDDLLNLIDLLHIKQAILCGLSMGGYIALRAYEKFPERINGLILCDTKSEADSDEAKIKRAVNINLIKTLGKEIFVDDFLKSIFYDETLNNNSEVVSFIRNIILSNSPIGICGALLALASRTDTTKVLDLIRVPTCIIVGEHDKLTPPNNAKIMAEKIRNSELQIIPNSGHISNLENPQAFNKTIMFFLNRYWN